MPGIFGSEIREIGEIKSFADFLILEGGLRFAVACDEEKSARLPSFVSASRRRPLVSFG
jgi:hypothetical protein